VPGSLLTLGCHWQRTFESALLLMTIRLSLGGVLSVLSPDIQLSLGESAGFSADIRLSLAENFRECASPGDN
jgi:hypothetical protein